MEWREFFAETDWVAWSVHQKILHVEWRDQWTSAEFKNIKLEETGRCSRSQGEWYNGAVVFKDQVW